VCAVGNNLIHWTGAGWEEYTAGVTTSAPKYDGVGSQIFAVGEDSTLVTYKDCLWQQESAQALDTEGGVTLRGVAVATDAAGALKEVWAVGDQTVIRRTTDVAGTATWATVPIPRTVLQGAIYEFTAVWARAPGDVFVVGISEGPSVLLHDFDGTWSLVRLPTRQTFSCVTGSADGRVWISRNTAVVLRIDPDAGP
jgi:hypothetical protein